VKTIPGLINNFQILLKGICNPEFFFKAQKITLTNDIKIISVILTFSNLNKLPLQIQEKFRII